MQQRITDKSIPFSRSCLCFCRTWERRERAIRCCVNVIFFAVRSKSLSCTRPVSHNDRTRADDAVRIWQTVRSEFFFPPHLMHFGKKQMADSRDDQMTTQRQIVTNLEMAQPQFAFFIFKTSLHMPAGKADMKQYFQRCTLRGIGDKVFDLFRVFHIASDNQPMRPRWQIIPLQVELDRFGFPYHGAFCRILDMELFPPNLSQYRRVK